MNSKNNLFRETAKINRKREFQSKGTLIKQKVTYLPGLDLFVKILIFDRFFVELSQTRHILCC